MKHLAYLISCITLFVSCMTSSEIQSVSLEKKNTIMKLSDSIYLSGQVNCIESSKGYTYISDLYGGLYSLNEGMVLSKKLSDIGNGKSELSFPDRLYVDNKNTVTIYDGNKKRYLYFTENGYVRQDSCSISDVRIAGSCRFFCLGDTVYSSITHDKHTVALTRNGKLISKMFPLTKGMDDIRRPIDSQRHLLWTGESILLVGRCLLPYIQEYTKEGELASDFDLREVDILRGIYKNKKPDKPNSTFVVTRDACYSNGNIYLLVSSDTKPYRCNTIVVLHKYGYGMKHIATFTLDKKMYSTFCVTDDNKLMAVNSHNSSVEIYEIPNINVAEFEYE